MKTEVIDASGQYEAGTQKGGRIIRDGGLVAFPTETVYGLGADGLNEEAVKGIFQAKGRPQDNPLILHVRSKNEARKLWDSVPEKAQMLMDAFWPGPLTLVYTKADCVPEIVSAGLSTVALRMPDNKTARALIKAAGTPIAAPSANISGRPSPTTAKHVLEDMEGKIPLVIDGGPCRHGLESTVLSVGAAPVLLRPGAVTQSMIEAVIGPINLHKNLLSPLGEGESAASPGMKYKHYSPDAEVIVVDGNLFKVAERISELYEEYTQTGKSCMILATEQTRHFYHEKEYVIIGDRRNPGTLCANLFSCLRTSGAKAECLLCEGMPAQEAGLAFMNRLLRAAGFQCEKV
ncbi:threonylcarbamoyl-AMP synthase [Christensenellaceae bacterium OttesenSCG-928-M15]|nr:threonylcarbamoyl-AMP synthase [Christensenellaceae bacterium OttesenSCG-928-M15]